MQNLHKCEYRTDPRSADPTTDRVVTTYGPVHGLPVRTPSMDHPQNRIKIRNKYFSCGLSTTSFPGSLILPPPGASEERPWLGLVTCLPESGRWQLNDWRDGRPSRILSILSLRECGMCCHQSKPRTIWCSAAMSGGNILQTPRKLIHHLIVEIQVAEGCMVQWRTLHIVKISSRRRMENYTPQPRLCMEDVWLIFTSEWSVGLVIGD